MQTGPAWSWIQIKCSATQEMGAMHLLERKSDEQHYWRSRLGWVPSHPCITFSWASYVIILPLYLCIGLCVLHDNILLELKRLEHLCNLIFQPYFYRYRLMNMAIPAGHVTSLTWKQIQVHPNHSMLFLTPKYQHYVAQNESFSVMGFI